MLALIDKNIWTFYQDLVLLGIPVGARMSLVEVNEGELLAISPIKMTDSVLRQIKEAGEIKWIVAPNSFHHMYVNGCQRAFPEAMSFAPRSLLKKRTDLTFTGVIENGAKYPWDEVLQTHLYEPSSSFSEAMFFHNDSGTLIVTDFLFNLKDPKTWYLKLATRALNMSGELRIGRLMKWVSRDASEVGRVLEKVREWKPRRLILAHGDLVEGDVAVLLEKAIKKAGLPLPA